MSDLFHAAGSRGADHDDRQEIGIFVTFWIDEQLFGVPVLRVREVRSTDAIAAIPLAPPSVRGTVNRRGQIVTVIDVRVRLGLPPNPGNASGMGVTVEAQNDLYSLLVDDVGEAIELADDAFSATPGTLDSVWRKYAAGIYRLEDRLMVVLDVDRLIDF